MTPTLSNYSATRTSTATRASRMSMGQSSDAATRRPAIVAVWCADTSRLTNTAASMIATRLSASRLGRVCRSTEWISHSLSDSKRLLVTTLDSCICHRTADDICNSRRTRYGVTERSTDTIAKLVSKKSQKATLSFYDCSSDATLYRTSERSNTTSPPLTWRMRELSRDSYLDELRVRPSGSQNPRAILITTNDSHSQLLLDALTTTWNEEQPFF